MAADPYAGAPPQDYRDELATPACRSQVHVLTQRAAQDVRFDEPLADACFEDRARLCDGVQPVEFPAPLLQACTLLQPPAWGFTKSCLFLESCTTKKGVLPLQCTFKHTP